ncbi:hypothetical protein WJ0W_006455 [Paenibacillus melissococcoides]|uniref:Uncharacterized protein n=1 Tax=Paenibacillus melissococcoides TaxID=2912268 RepID=A0ABM9GCW0_9BACL|nr:MULTISPECIES: hypothetical protein [Paenibacillus]CAH8249269.1 hypothetical protein WJ0W_006455 [Paenibacillus melissococcoides]
MSGQRKRRVAKLNGSPVIGRKQEAEESRGRPLINGSVRLHWPEAAGATSVFNKGGTAEDRLSSFIGRKFFLFRNKHKSTQYNGRK